MSNWREDEERVSSTILNSRSYELSDMETFMVQHYDVPSNLIHHYRCKVIDLCSLHWTKVVRDDPKVFFRAMDEVLKHEEIRNDYVEDIIREEIDPDFTPKKTNDYPIELEM